MQQSNGGKQIGGPKDKLSVACFQAGQLGDKSIAVRSMKLSEYI